MPKTGKPARIYQVITVTQQPDDSASPNFFDYSFFEEQLTPYTMFTIQTTPGDGDMDMRMLIELSAISVQGCQRSPKTDPLFS